MVLLQIKADKLFHDTNAVKSVATVVKGKRVRGQDDTTIDGILTHSHHFINHFMAVSLSFLI